MKFRNIALMTGVLFFMLSGPVASQNWVDIKDPKDLRALFSNKTFRSTVGGVSVVEHYRADGKGVFDRLFWRDAYSLHLGGQGQRSGVYIRCEEGRRLLSVPTFQENRDEYVRRCQYDSYMGTFIVEDGVPEF